MLPEVLGQRFEFSLVPGDSDRLGALFQSAPVGYRPLAKMPPGILEDMEVVILDQGRLPKHRSDGVIVGLAAIDVEGLERDPKPLKSLQKRLDTLLITLIDRLSGQNPPMLVLHHQHTVMQAARKEFVQVAFGDGGLPVQALDDLVSTWQVGCHFPDPALQRRFRDCHMKQHPQQPLNPPVTHACNHQQHYCGAHQHLRYPAAAVHSARLGAEIDTLAFLIEVVPLARQYSIPNWPRQGAQFLYLIFIRFSPVKGGTLGNAKTLVMVLVLRIDRDDQRHIFIAAAYLTIGVCLNDRGGDRNGYLYRHVPVTSPYEYTLGGNHDPSMKSTH